MEDIDENFRLLLSARKRWMRCRLDDYKMAKKTRSPSRKIRNEYDFLRVMSAMLDYLAARDVSIEGDSQPIREMIERTRDRRKRELLRMYDDYIIIGLKVILRLSPLLRDEMEIWEEERQKRVLKSELTSI